MSEIMAINNVSMEQQIGMLTGVTEITRNASSASRGLVMISSRLTQVLDESSSTGKKLTKIYSDLGIELLNEEGQLRSHYDILGDLADKWNGLSENQQKYIALTSAGARQQQNFVALMANWSKVAEATTTAYKSMGSAQKENEKVMDSIAKKVEILRSEFQQLVIGEGGLQDFAKTILDIGIALLKFANSDVGEVTIKTVAFIATISLLNTALRALTSDAIPKLITSMVTFATRLTATGVTSNSVALSLMGLSEAEAISAASTMTLSEAFETLTVAMLSNPAVIVAAGLTAIVAISLACERAMEKFNKRLQDANETLENLSDDAKNAKSELDNLKKSLKNIQDQIKKNNQEKLRITDQESLEKLEKESTELAKQEQELKRQVILQEKKLELIKLQAEEQAKTTLETTTESQFKRQNVVDSFSGAETGETKGIQVTPEEELNLAIEKYKELKKVAEELQEQLDKTDPNTKEWNELNEELNKTNAEMQTVSERGVEMATVITNAIDNLSDGVVKSGLLALVDGFLALIGAEEDAADETNQVGDELDDADEEVDELSKELENLIQSLGITKTEFKGLEKAFGGNREALLRYLNGLAEVRQELADTSTIIDNLQDALTTASDALKEYNQNGYLTIDTFQSLMGISAQYLAELVNENGQLEINQSTLGNLVDQLKIAKIEELAHAAALEIASLQYDDTDANASNAQKSVDAAGDAFTRAGDKAAKASAGVALFNSELDKATGGTAGDYTGQEKVIIEKYRKLAKEISTLTVNTTAAGNAASNAGKKGSSAAKDTKDATKELNKELEETKKKYEKVISWISKQYDKEIDKIKKAKDEAIKAEEEKIKAKEKEKDAALDAIEAEIRALEREKNALKEQKEALDAKKQALKDEEDAIVKGVEKRIKALEKERDALIKPIEERIKVLEKERDAIIKSTEAEIDSLNELKEKRQAYWDEQIDALKKANQELKENLELQEKLDALEKAKNTKVKIYKEGQGFVYDVDQNAVQQAQKALDDYLSEKAYEDELARLESLKNAEIKSYDDRLKELNDYKDNTKKIYDQQIEDLKEYKEAVQEQYEEQIELINKDIDALEKHMDELDKHKDALEEHKDAVEKNYEAEIAELEAHKEAIEKAYDAEIQIWENYKQEFENMVNAYEEEQNRLLFEQLTGIKAENSNWMTRLDNLAKFVNEYNKLQKQLETDNTNVQNTASFSNGSTPSGNTTVGSDNKKPKYDNRGFRINEIPTTSKKPKYDSRGFEIKSSQGLTVGSALSGQTISLNSGTGTGFVNTNPTNSLTGILNNVGRYGASGFGGGNSTLNNSYNNDSLVINGVTIQGNNIKDPETFVNSLLNLKSEALQRAYQHK